VLHKVDLSLTYLDSYTLTYSPGTHTGNKHNNGTKMTLAWCVRDKSTHNWTPPAYWCRWLWNRRLHKHMLPQAQIIWPSR